MKAVEAPSKFFWLDLETTGLEPASGDRIIEVAALITDVLLDDIAVYHSMVRPEDEAELRRLLAENPFWVSRPDEMEQIVAETRTGKPEIEIEADLIALAEQHYGENEPIFLAGNTIYFDKNFVQYWLPDFASKLRYRILDVSSFKLWWMANGKPEYKKQKKHRALEDIRESIAELKHYSQDIKF